VGEGAVAAAAEDPLGARGVVDGVAPAAGAGLVPAPAAALATAAPDLAPTAAPSPAPPRGRRPRPGPALAPDPGAALLRPTEPPGRGLKARPNRQERMETDPLRTSNTG